MLTSSTAVIVLCLYILLRKSQFAVLSLFRNAKPRHSMDFKKEMNEIKMTNKVRRVKSFLQTIVYINLLPI